MGPANEVTHRHGSLTLSDLAAGWLAGQLCILCHPMPGGIHGEPLARAHTDLRGQGEDLNQIIEP